MDEMPNRIPERGFRGLDPMDLIRQVEERFSLRLQDSFKTYTSYVNRVYGLKDEDGNEFVAKFYRPLRWNRDQILEEHRFLADCQAVDLPVVSPLEDRSGSTLPCLDVVEAGSVLEFHYALFPCRSGRTFDADREEDWIRLGTLIGRLHLVGSSFRAPSRVICHPSHSTTEHLQYLWDEAVVNTDIQGEFFDLAEDMLDRISPAFDGTIRQRVHGDLHRGNILDRGKEGLLLVDFDDMMQGPPVQDLWLMLPGRREDSGRELGWFLSGYTEFRDFDHSSLDLIEPLRYMRMVHYLAWCARQRQDPAFSANFPAWGSRSFWIKETEDLRDQDRALREAGF